MDGSNGFFDGWMMNKYITLPPLIKISFSLTNLYISLILSFIEDI